MKPRLLDLFCGAGGATRGYQLAGFHVTGVDINSQPHYVGDAFHQADAMSWDPWSIGQNYDAVHASPPCQHYANVTQWTGTQDDHPALIAPMRDRLNATGLPWVMENVRTAELKGAIVLCGSQFGLPIRRHRYFESNVALPWFSTPCQHRSTDLAFEHKGERAYAVAMGVPWMTNVESRQAIPPAYTEWIGAQLMASLKAAA